MNIDKISLPPHGKRLIYDLGPYGVPEVRYFAAQNLSHTSPGLPTHLHKGCMEINHFLKGERVYRVGNEDYHLRGNQVFITWPDEVHGSGAYLHGRGLHFWLQIQLPKPGSPFIGFDSSHAAPLLEGIWSLPRRQFRADPAMQGIYSRILQLCRHEPQTLSPIAVSSLLAQWFLLLISSAREGLEDAITPDIALALDMIQSNPAKPRSIAELAEAAHLSESHFKIKFKQQMGLPPGDYLLRRRVEAAAERLLHGRMNITEIAYDFQFSSSQHFSTTFKKIFGKSPQAWLRERAQGRRGRDSGGNGGAGGLTPWLEDGILHGFLCE